MTLQVPSHAGGAGVGHWAVLQRQVLQLYTVSTSKGRHSCSKEKHAAVKQETTTAKANKSNVKVHTHEETAHGSLVRLSFMSKSVFV